jgi:transketolase
MINFDPKKPLLSERDRVVLSKGHGCLALYAILVDKGFFPASELDTTSQVDSILGGHPEHAQVPGVEATTGALGHGFPISVGMALAAKIKKQKHKVYTIVGDGEINEGSVWEAALSASRHNLSNLKVLVDYNKIQSYDFVKNVSKLEPIVDKWKSFGFDVSEVNGHDIKKLKKNLELFVNKANSKPSVTICHTIKGKGFYFAENNPEWHYRRSFSKEEIKKLDECLR